MDFEDLKNKSQEELKELLATTTQEVRQSLAKAKLGHLKQVHTIANFRRTVARIKTLLKV